MKIAAALAGWLALAAAGRAAEPVFLDELVERPLHELASDFPDLKKEGCYRVGEGKYLLMTIDDKDQKPWRVVLASAAPCERADDAAALDVRHRSGVLLGDTTRSVLDRLGQPEMSGAPQAPHGRLGDTEYFYLCRVEEMCARHTSIFLRNGVVTAISEWYSK